MASTETSYWNTVEARKSRPIVGQFLQEGRPAKGTHNVQVFFCNPYCTIVDRLSMLYICLRTIHNGSIFTPNPEWANISITPHVGRRNHPTHDASIFQGNPECKDMFIRPMLNPSFPEAQVGQTLTGKTNIKDTFKDIHQVRTISEISYWDCSSMSCPWVQLHSNEYTYHYIHGCDTESNERWLENHVRLENKDGELERHTWPMLRRDVKAICK